MIELFKCATPLAALNKLGEKAEKNEGEKRETIVFCDDTLTLQAEQAICEKIGGTFYASVYSFSKYLARYESGKDVLSAEGSVMLLRRIIYENKENLKLFGKLSPEDAVDSVYETISRFYASGISSEQLEDVLKKSGDDAATNQVLRKKLEDLSVIFSAYEKELEKIGKKDRAGYLDKLPDFMLRDGELERKDVVFFGFGEFSKTGEKILRAAMKSAKNVCGIFVGGDDKKIYRNETSDLFASVVAEMKRSGIWEGEYDEEYVEDEGSALGLAEGFKKTIFHPERRCVKAEEKIYADGRVSMYEAADGAEEIEYIATEIKRNLAEGKCGRYREIAVMIPDTENAQREIRNTFSRYGIPCYIDVKHPVLAHSLYLFVQNLFMCSQYGLSFSYVDDIVASAYFPEERKGDKLAFRNYMAKYGKYKWSVKKPVDSKLCENLVAASGAEREKKAKEFAEAAERVRTDFLDALKYFEDKPVKTTGETMYEGTKALFESEKFHVEKTCEDIYSQFGKDDELKKYLEEAEFTRRAPRAILEILEEAADLSENLDRRGYLKMIRSGAHAKRLSLTPAKLDAVFIGDISKTLCINKKIVFAARMTDDVPAYSQDTKFISDRDITKIADIWGLDFGPKVEEDNLAKKETVALNMCSFRERLYIGYPVRIDKDEHGMSEIMEYARAAFRDAPFWDGLEARKVSDLKKEDPAYYCCEFYPALMWAASDKDRGERYDAVVKTLKDSNVARFEEARGEEILSGKEKERGIGGLGKTLFCSQGENCFSPTTLESYFSCPYRNFVDRGLGAGDSAGDDTSHEDVGDFVHGTLKELSDEYLDKEGACKIYGLDDKEKFAERARAKAVAKLKEPPFNALCVTKKGRYDSDRLCDEVKKIAREIFEQLERSDFDICKAEDKVELKLNDVYSLTGYVDRVDLASESGVDMVKVIDYKTGGKKASPREYYHGTALQLPLYLAAEAETMSASPAGAFYFPAIIEYSSDGGKIILSGYSDGTHATMEALDKDFESDEKRHMDAKFPKAKKTNGKTGKNKVEYSEEETEDMQREDFGKYLEYGRLVSIEGIKEMAEEGYIEPSPIGNACAYCGFKGCCGLDAGKDSGVRSVSAAVSFDYVVKAVPDEIEAENEKGE